MNNAGTAALPEEKNFTYTASTTTNNNYSVPQVQTQQYTSSTYTPLTNFIPSTYTQQQSVPENNNKSTLDFKTNEEREAYITRLLADRTSPAPNVASKVSYTTFTDGKPVEQITSYTNNLTTPTY